MNSPFTKRFGDLPLVLQSAMKGWGITPTLQGASFINELWQEPALRKRTIIEAAAKFPDHLQTDISDRKKLRLMVIKELDELAESASHSTKICDLEPWETNHWIKNQKPTPLVEQPIPAEMLTKWHKVNPRRLQTLEPTSMRQLELKLWQEWATRLTHIILPHTQEMPEVSTRATMDNPFA